MARYAISDIHGCLLTFRRLVEDGISLGTSDELYLLGDYINKGPDSKGVLDYIIELQRQGYRVLCLRGNHDQLLIDAREQGEPMVWLSEEEKRLTLSSFGVSRFGDIPEVYIDFARGLSYFHELPDVVLVHAGFDFSRPPEIMFQDKRAMLRIKDFEVDTQKLQGRRLVHGHNPQPLSALQKVLKRKGPALNLDTGCVYIRNEGLGYLVALNLDSLQLTVQQNIDRPYPVRVK